jgi:PleD family two-component response regulator
LLYATGHFRSGILLSGITGEIVSDLVQGRNPSIDLAPFLPARFADQAQIKVLALFRDILFRSRIDAAAQALGIEVAYVSDWDLARKQCGELRPATIVVDLSDAAFQPEKIHREIRAAAGNAHLIGIASHVDLKALSGARKAGFEVVLSRSEFVARLPELLAAPPRS